MSAFSLERKQKSWLADTKKNLEHFGNKAGAVLEAGN
jgi:hypothetical protein